jgi:phospholipid/cholesterol/gamma-HCH transport system permease protein
MTSARCDCRITGDASGSLLALSGGWQLVDIAQSSRLLAGKTFRDPVMLDGSALESLDSASALVLLEALASAGIAPEHVSLAGFSPSHQRVFDGVRQRLLQAVPSPPEFHRRWIAEFGRKTLGVIAMLGGLLSFFGATASAFFEVLVHPSRLRRRELTAQLEQVCLNAIPVVALVTLLIGVTIAYLLGLQAERYGANIFVVDGVGIGMSREFGPIIVAVIVAGRSGAAFTAQLGSMRMAEEIDAIRTLGLSPMQVLVVPRVLALMLGLPLLVFIGTVMGVVGAMLVAGPMLGITPLTFVDRLHDSLDIIHVWVGLGKAPFFAALIALIGCNMGMTVERDTRAVGLATTSTVVQGIVAVIVLDAAFAILCQEMGW